MASQGLFDSDILMERLSSFQHDRPDDPFIIDEINGSYSRGVALELIEAISKALNASLGASGERVSILSENCADWILADLAIILSGHVSAPLFTTMTAEKFSYAVNFVDVKLLFLGPAANWEAIKSEAPKDMLVVSLPHIEPYPGTLSFDEFLARGVGEPAPKRPDADALCSLILTSGTTGNPKAVMHSLRTLTHVTEAFKTITRQDGLKEKRLVCHLPLAHVGEKVVTVMQSLLIDATITIGRGANHFLDDLRTVRPTLVLGVPRIWERLIQLVVAQFADNGDDLRASLEADTSGALAADIREFLGLSEATCCISAGAISPPFVKDWFNLFGIEVSDFYGQTEILPLTCQRSGEQVAGSVGTAAPGFDLRISPDGEILGRGAGTALGYFKDTENTAATFRDGWVYTGDKGYLDDNGNLFIVGRMGDIFKTAKGKYVAPEPIENLFSDIPVVEQQLLHGLGLTQPVMLCTLSAEATRRSEPEIERALQQATAEINQQLEPHERIGAIIIDRQHWTIERGLLTHTHKAIRERISSTYFPHISALGDALREGQRNLITWA